MSLSILVLRIRHKEEETRIPLVVEALRKHADFLEQSTQTYQHDEKEPIPGIGKRGQHQATDKVSI